MVACLIRLYACMCFVVVIISYFFKYPFTENYRRTVETKFQKDHSGIHHLVSGFPSYLVVENPKPLSSLLLYFTYQFHTTSLLTYITVESITTRIYALCYSGATVRRRAGGQLLEGKSITHGGTETTS